MCPHVNQSDPRCGRHLRLDDLAWAFSYCVERPAACPIYWEIASDDGKCRHESPNGLVTAG